MPLINQDWYHAHASSHLESGHLIPDFVHYLLAYGVPAFDLNHIDSVPRLQKKVDLATFQALRLALTIRRSGKQKRSIQIQRLQDPDKVVAYKRFELQAEYRIPARQLLHGHEIVCASLDQTTIRFDVLQVETRIIVAYPVAHKVGSFPVLRIDPLVFGNETRRISDCNATRRTSWK